MMRATFPVLSRVGQRVLNGLLRTTPRGFLNRKKLFFLLKCRSLLVRLGDPLVRYHLDGMDILLPLSHDLPFYRKSFPHYSSNVARIAGHVKQKYPGLTFIDIGANVGDTVAIVRSVTHFPILCIEGDERYFAILRTNTEPLPDVSLECQFVGTATGAISAKVDTQRGTGRLLYEQGAGDGIAVKTLSEMLKGKPLFANSKMIKLDTDGLDCEILKSELALLSETKPVVFFEYAPDLFADWGDGFTVFENLLDIGYRKAIVYENNGDYLMTVDLGHRSSMEDIHNFYTGRSHERYAQERYADICVFHHDDVDLCQIVRHAEIGFFRTLRCHSLP